MDSVQATERGPREKERVIGVDTSADCQMTYNEARVAYDAALDIFNAPVFEQASRLEVFREEQAEALAALGRAIYSGSNTGNERNE